MFMCVSRSGVACFGAPEPWFVANSAHQIRRLILGFLLISGLCFSGCAHTGPGTDKLGHMTAGIVASKLVSDRTESQLAGCVTSLVLGLAKEAYDRGGRGTVERNDVYATMSGGGCAFSFTF